MLTLSDTLLLGWWVTLLALVLGLTLSELRAIHTTIKERWPKND